MLKISAQQDGIRFLSASWNNFQCDKNSIIFSHNKHMFFKKENACLSNQIFRYNRSIILKVSLTHFSPVSHFYTP